MAVLKKIRSRLFPLPLIGGNNIAENGQDRTTLTSALLTEVRYDIRPLTMLQLEECWRLDQRCFIDGEAYSRDTFEYLLTSPDTIAYRAVTMDGTMAGFIFGIIEPDLTGHVTTLGVAPEHRRRGIAHRMMAKVEEGFRRRNVSLIRLEVRSVNTGAQQLYNKLGYTATQRLPRYYSNGGDGLLMIKSLD